MGTRRFESMKGFLNSFSDKNRSKEGNVVIDKKLFKK